MSASIIRKLEQAHTRLQNGDVATAASLCEGVLKRAPQNPQALWLLGAARVAAGNARDAVPLLERAVEGMPQHGAALEHLGLSYLMTDRHEQAEAALRRAAALPGAPASVYMRWGIAVLNQQRFDEAIAHLNEAIARDAECALCHVNLGRALADAGSPEAAQEHFRRALQLDAGALDALFNLGVLALKRGHLSEAKAWLERALAREPQLLDARKGLASACAGLGRHKEAAGHLRELLAHDPNNAWAWSSLGGALFELGRIDESEAAGLRALALDSALPGPYSLLAQVHFVRSELEHSVSRLEQGFDRTGADGLLGMLTHQLRRTCQWDRWRLAWTELQSRLERSDDLGSPFWLLHENVGASGQLSYTRRWASARFAPFAPTREAQTVKGLSRKRNRLRIGYLSSDFQEHAAAYLIAGVLEQHDRDRFEIFAYSYGPEQPTPMRARLRAACEHFIDVAWEADDAIVRRIRDDELDVLVDLKGYTLGARTSILAQRPCAIQVNWLGYPGTMGAPFIDYLIADHFIVPPGEQSAYSERVVRLEHCWQCNDRSRPLPEPLTRAAYGLREEHFVFCCFTQCVKITPEVFECWMRLLARVPESVLWLAEDNPLATRNLLREARTCGVAPERLVLAPRLRFADHLSRYRVADLALDTFPYTSHSTASDALWAGCPVVALCGETFASRVSGSILTHAGLPELVTRSIDAYEALACTLATERTLLNAVRTRVAEAKSSPLFDAESFARELEALYLQITQA